MSAIRFDALSGAACMRETHTNSVIPAINLHVDYIIKKVM
jgi:hypothetical protein